MEWSRSPAAFWSINHCPRTMWLSAIVIDLVSGTTFFLLFFRWAFIENIIVPETNNNFEVHLDIGEFLRFIGLWILITKNSPGNCNRTKFWSSCSVGRDGGAPFLLNDIMTGKRFEAISNSLAFTIQTSRTGVGKFGRW